MSRDQPRPTVVFGPFEADLQTQELRKSRIRLRLPGQSFQILKMLLERPGELVSREELHKALWPSDTFVDFEHGVNAAVNRLREALGDSADCPAIIETLPRRGYRFIGAITKSPNIANTSSEPGKVISASPALGQEKATTHGRVNWVKIGAWILVGGTCAFAAEFAYLRLRPRAEPVTPTPVPFMTYPGLKFCPTFSPDGSQIVFAWNGDPESGSKGFDLYVKVIGSENLLRLTHHPSEYICPAWSPDGTQIAFHRLSDAATGVYVVPALGGSERKLRSTRTPIHAWVYAMISWSPDGKWIAYAEALPPAQYQDLHLLSVETLESRQIPRAAKCHNAVKPAFSRSGAQLAYSCAHTPADFEVGIYTVATFGGTSRLVTTFTGRGTAGGVAWTDGDKKLIFSHDRFGPGTGLDEITLADGSLRKLPFAQEGRWPVISSKGDKLAYVTSSYHVDIWRKDLLSPQAPAVKLISSTFDQRTPQYSPDGKHIAFESTRGGVREVWMSDADGTHLIQISNFREQLTGTPRWSPDSQKIVFDSRQSGHAELYIADIAERMPRKLATNITVVYVPSWSHDGKWIYFISGGADPQRRIYRCPANGGDAVLLAALPVGDFAYGPVESFDGSTVYFATRFRGAQLYAVSLKRVGAATMLKGMPLVSLYYLWTVAPGGIYFVPADAPKSVRYFDFETSKVREIFKVDRDFDVGLSVSSDARWILYTQVSEEKSDIMLVEHFR